MQDISAIVRDHLVGAVDDAIVRTLIARLSERFERAGHELLKRYTAKPGTVLKIAVYHEKDGGNTLIEIIRQHDGGDPHGLRAYDETLEEMLDGFGTGE